MKHPVKHIIIGGFIAATALAFSCSDSERRMGLLGQTSTVVINLGLPADDTASDRFLVDRLRRLFARDAIAQTAPAAFSTIRVRVTAADIGVIEKEFNPYGTITLTVPAGSLRQFEVTAYVAAGDPSAATSFRGTAYANLPAGQTVTVPVAMGLNETKIVVPDWGNQCVVFIDNFTTPNWTKRTVVEWTAVSSPFRPYDVDFDNRGRIYIANNTTQGVIRVDDINGVNIIASSAGIFGGHGNIVTIAVDRVNQLAYFATTIALYRSNLDGSSTISRSLSSTPISPSSHFIRGIDVDAEGMLYIVAEPMSAGTSYIVKYNPATESQIGSSYSTSLANPWDVIVRGSNIYVANYGQYSAGYHILQFTFTNNTFNLTAHNGSRSTLTTGTGYFYGASRFLAIRNDLFFIADSNHGATAIDYDKLAAFRDMAFTGWSTFGSYGSSINQFKLYSQC